MLILVLIVASRQAAENMRVAAKYAERWCAIGASIRTLVTRLPLEQAENMTPVPKENTMHHPHFVMLKLHPFLPIESRFWLTDDCWNGSAEELGISVQAGSFEQAKADLELALGRHIESMLRERKAKAHVA